MAETRSKAKAKGPKDDADTKSNFISALSKKYKPRKSYNENDTDQDRPPVKRFETPGKVSFEGKITQSQPFPFRPNQSGNTAENESGADGTGIERDENPFYIECSDEEKGTNSAKNNDLHVDDLVKQKTYIKDGDIPSLNEAQDIVKSQNVDDLLHISPLANDNIENDGKFILGLQNLYSEEHKDDIKVYFESDMVALPSSNQPNCSGQKNSSSSKENSTCSCSVKLTRSHGNLVKISEELKNISNIIENIKKELEKCTK